ncbi:MAG: hypothetical protein II943_09830 [Victivallales bacterium]|nr:hypothetical protein [Victivallales bacterium]
MSLLLLCRLVWFSVISAGDLPASFPELRNETSCPVIYSDDGIFVNQEPGIVRIWGPASSYRATIEITRYYGTRLERSKQIAVGLMPKYAILSILAGDCDVNATGFDYPPEIDRVFFNGKELGFLTGEDDKWIVNTFRIPCEEINFPSAPGEIGKNKLEIIVDSANDEPRWYLEQFYQSLEIPGPWPIFLVHGWTTNENAMAHMQSLIRQYYGIPSELAEAPMDNSPETNGGLLNEQLEGFTQSYGISMFNIIAHSKGGLDSRALIDQGDVNSPYVHRLMQIATPNAGSHLADILIDPDGFMENLAIIIAKQSDPAYKKITPGLVSLTPASCAEFNLTHCHPNAPISTLIGRVRNFQPFDGHDDNEDGRDRDGGWDYYSLGQFCYDHDYHSDNPRQQGDGIVTVLSAHALGTQIEASPIDSKTTNYSHSNIIQAGALGALALYQDLLFEMPPRNFPEKPELRSGGTAEDIGVAAVNPVARLHELEASNPQEDSATMYVKSALVEAGQEISVPFELTTEKPDPLFLFLRAPRTVQIQLTAPDGQSHLVPAALVDDFSEQEFLQQLGGRILALENTPPGVYVAHLANPDDEPACITVACRFHGVLTEIALDSDTNCLPGLACRLTVRLLQDGVVVPQSNLPLRCHYRAIRENENETAALQDIPLEYCDDGLYCGSFIPPEEGEYLIVADWLDSFGAPALQRQIRLNCNPVFGSIQPGADPGQKISSPLSPQTAFFQSADSIVQSKALRFQFDASVSHPGQYCLAATLKTSDGTAIATAAQRREARQAGRLHFTLDFDGTKIYDSHADGPYIVDDLQLSVQSDTGAVKILAAGQGFRTGKFSYQDFLHAPLAFGGIEREWLETHQENERDSWTSLHFLLNVQVAPGLSGNYCLGGTLTTANGYTIKNALSAPIAFNPDNNSDITVQFELAFDTDDLLEHGVPGPYCLCGLYVRSEQTGTIYYCPGEAQTLAYSLEQFGNHLETVCLREIKGLELTTVQLGNGLYQANIVFTRHDRRDGGPAFFKPGAPLMGPFGIAIAEDNPSGVQIVNATPLTLPNGNFQYLDCNEEALTQLQHQGNHDQRLDHGETLAFTFQFTCPNSLDTMPEFSLVGRMPTPLGRELSEYYLRHCLVTDLDQDFQISDEEATAARQKWKDGGLSHHILLQTLEFHKAPGYRFNPLLNDFEPLENGKTE